MDVERSKTTVYNEVLKTTPFQYIRKATGKEEEEEFWSSRKLQSKKGLSCVYLNNLCSSKKSNQLECFIIINNEIGSLLPDYTFLHQYIPFATNVRIKKKYEL